MNIIRLIIGVFVSVLIAIFIQADADLFLYLSSYPPELAFEDEVYVQCYDMQELLNIL